MHCIRGYPVTLLIEGLHQCNHPLENACGIVNVRRNGCRSCGAGLWSCGVGCKAVMVGAGTVVRKIIKSNIKYLKATKSNRRDTN
jgi:hypothetical protein